MTFIRSALPLLLCCCSWGCIRTGAENLGTKRSAAVDLNKLSSPASLLAALGRQGPAIDPLLGAHAFAIHSTVQVSTKGLPVETLEENVRMDCDGKGNFHLLRNNSHSQGMEAIGAANLLYVRSRFAPFTTRRAEADDAVRLRALGEGQAKGTLTIFADWLSIKENANSMRDGHKIRHFALSALASPRRPANRPAAERWRATMQVTSLAGDLAIDATTGAALEMTLHAEYTFVRESSSGPIAVKVEFEQRSAAPDPIVVPSDALASPRRPRPLLDRQTLLEGLNESTRARPN